MDTPPAGRILALYDALQAHFGYEPHWWPLFSADPAFEVVVGAVLVQQTRWESVEGAVQRLIAADLLTPRAIAAADTAELALLIRPCAFHTQKAPGLQAIARHLLHHHGGDVRSLLRGERQAARAELLALPRIGRETADTIMLYAGEHPAFIADAYARRLFGRVGIFPEHDLQRLPYDSFQALVEDALTPWQPSADGAYPHLDGTLRHFMWDLHALINEACIHHCLTAPRCDQVGARRAFLDPRKCAHHCRPCTGCPLRPQCAEYQHNRKAD